MMENAAALPTSPHPDDGDASSCAFAPFEGCRCEIAQRRVPPLGIIEALNVVKERGACVGWGAKRVAREEFALQGGKEGFGDGVIITITDAAHRDLRHSRLHTHVLEIRRAAVPRFRHAVVGLLEGRLTGCRVTFTLFEALLPGEG